MERKSGSEGSLGELEAGEEEMEQPAFRLACVVRRVADQWLLFVVPYDFDVRGPPLTMQSLDQTLLCWIERVLKGMVLAFFVPPCLGEITSSITEVPGLFAL